MILKNEHSGAELWVTMSAPWKKPVLMITKNGYQLEHVATFRNMQAAEEFKTFIRRFLND